MPTATAPSRRPRNRQGQGSRLRDELITAAARLLDRTGDEEGLTLRAVAREAGVAAPSVYLHFASKEELVRAVMRAHFAELREAIEAAAAAAPPTPDARLRAGCLAYCRFAVEQPGAYRVMFGNTRSGFTGEGWEDLPGTDTFAFLADGIAANMASGTVRPGDAQFVATQVWATLHGIVTLRWAVPMFPWPPVEELVDAVLAGLVGLEPGTSDGQLTDASGKPEATEGPASSTL